MDKRLIGFYLDAFIASMLYFTPIYAVAYFANLNLSLGQIGILFAARSLCSLLSEIPTGVVADLYGRKKSTIIGYVIFALGALSVFLFNDFGWLLVAQAIMGIGTSFTSGATESWLAHLVGQKKFQKVLGHIDSLGNAGSIFSGLIGVFVVTQFGMRSMWLALFFSFVLGAIFMVTVPDNYKPKKVKHPYKDYIKQLRASLNVVKQSPNIKYFFISLLFLAILWPLSTNITWIPLLTGAGFNEASLGYIWSAMSAVGVFAPLLGNKLVEKIPRKKYNIVMMLFWGLLLLAIPFTNALTIFIVILLLTALFDYSRYPSFYGLFHSFLPEKYRATVSSMMALIISLGLVVGQPLGGYLAQSITPQWTLFIAGILLLPTAYFFSKINDA